MYFLLYCRAYHTWSRGWKILKTKPLDRRKTYPRKQILQNKWHLSSQYLRTISLRTSFFINVFFVGVYRPLNPSMRRFIGKLRELNGEFRVIHYKDFTLQTFFGDFANKVISNISQIIKFYFFIFFPIKKKMHTWL